MNAEEVLLCGDKKVTRSSLHGSISVRDICTRRFTSAQAFRLPCRIKGQILPSGYPKYFLETLLGRNLLLHFLSPQSLNFGYY